jgi:hypothetical protein
MPPVDVGGALHVFVRSTATTRTNRHGRTRIERAHVLSIKASRRRQELGWNSTRWRGASYQQNNLIPWSRRGVWAGPGRWGCWGWRRLRSPIVLSGLLRKRTCWLNARIGRRSPCGCRCLGDVRFVIPILQRHYWNIQTFCWWFAQPQRSNCWHCSIVANYWCEFSLYISYLFCTLQPQSYSR